MNAKLPPDPKRARSLQSWATQLYEYLYSNTRIGDVNNPLPVLLPHKVSPELERATTAGMLLYDPQQQAVVYSIDGRWEPISMDSRLFIAELEVKRRYGDTVSVAQAAKTVLKFGRNDDIDVTNLETIWLTGNDETYPTDNTIDTIVSTSASDTVDIELTGCTVVGTGSSAQYTEVTQTVTLTGTTNASLTTPLARVYRGRVLGATNLVGDVTVTDNTAATTHLTITGSLGDNQSYKAALTVPDGFYLFVTYIDAAILRGGSVQARIRIETAEPGQVFQPKLGDKSIQTDGTSTLPEQLDPLLVVKPNSEIRLRTVADAINTEIYGAFGGYYAKVIT